MCWSEDCRWTREEVGQTQLLGEREIFSVCGIDSGVEMPPATAFASPTLSNIRGCGVGALSIKGSSGGGRCR